MKKLYFNIKNIIKKKYLYLFALALVPIGIILKCIFNFDYTANIILNIGAIFIIVQTIHIFVDLDKLNTNHPLLYLLLYILLIHLFVVYLPQAIQYCLYLICNFLL